MATFYLPDCLTRETRMKFYMRFREPKLFRYAKSLEWDKIVKRCETRPRIAAREAKFQHEYAPNETPLHVVLHPFFLLADKDELLAMEQCDTIQCLLESRHRAAAALLDVYEGAAMITCVLGTCPLTLVCMDPFPYQQDVEMLTTACPKSALVQDLEGRTPLHYACINNRANVPMLKTLLKTCKEAASLPDKLGRTALHYACMAHPSHSGHGQFSSIASLFTDKLVEQCNKAPVSTEPVIRILLGANKNAASVMDKEGMTSLHHLCHYMEALNEVDPDLTAVLECLVEAVCPKIAAMPDSHGLIPIMVIRQALNKSETPEQYQVLKRTIDIY